MKRIILCLSLVFALLIGSTAIVNASVLTERAEVGSYYQTYGTARLQDASKPGYMLLSVSSSPDASIVLLDSMDTFCSVVDFLNLSAFIPGCDYVDFAGKFYKYVDKSMSVDVQLYDAGTGKLIDTYVFKDGTILYFGNDHPYGYTIKMKTHGISHPFVQLSCLSNVDWE